MQKFIDIIQEGILTDLIKAEQAISVYKVIAKNAKALNNSELFVRTSFSYLQKLVFDEYILAISRIYDKKNPRYQTRCIESALLYLKENKGDIPSVMQKVQLLKIMNEYSFPDFLMEQVQNDDKKGFLDNLIHYFEESLQENRNNLETIKTRKDKFISHNELIDNEIIVEVKKLNIDSVEPFLVFGWQFIVIVGWAFLNTIYGTDNNNLFLRKYGTDQGLHMKRLLQKIIPYV